MKIMTNKVRLYWPLIKSLQTGLLLSTGIAGYLSSRPPFDPATLLGLAVTLFLAISGSTIMNMWYDRDIDSKKRRTHRRPTVSGTLDPQEIFIVGMLISILGIGGAVMMDPLYGMEEADDSVGAVARGFSPAPLASDTPTDRTDTGAAWGTLIHGLLEHAMRHRDATRDDLARLARWLTVEHEDLRPSIPAALDTVEAVTGSDVWRGAQSSGDLHVEVPFAVLLQAGTGPEQGTGPSSPPVLRGVIDLVYRAADGWRIVDYKTDPVEGGVAGLLDRYGAQLGDYVDAWRTATGDSPARAGIFGVRHVEIGWKEPS